ncbi:MAG: PDZ domain-containing protein [Bryobacterales bacterium]|nr:PDZ domain-containing protein [Bryobacterales bacterium]
MRLLLPVFAMMLATVVAQAQDAFPEVLRAFTRVYAALEENAAEPVDPNLAIYDGALPGAIRALDPFSVFLTADRMVQLQEMQSSREKGFGSIVSILPGRIIVLQVLPETPMARAGIEPGDEFLAVNNYMISALTDEQIIELLSQSRQGQVAVVVRRPGSARPLQFTLVPQEMDSRSVDKAFLLANSIAYVHIKAFEGETARQFRDAMEKLGGDNLRGLILDMRDNPGGVIDSALDLSSFLLEPGSTILHARGRAQAPVVERVPAAAKPYRFPVVVLMNEKTASAAEIVAGALRDHKRARLLGQRSYGKGLVQRVFQLSEGNGLALTTSYYFTPSGESIQRPLKDSQVRKQGEQTTEPRDEQAAVALTGQGGIAPDETIDPAPTNQLRYVLEGTGAFASFATEYLRAGRQVTEHFQVDGAVLDEFQFFLSQRNLRPPLSMWTANSDYIRIRLKAEILNQSVGVEFGERVEAELDPAIQRAFQVLAGR